MSREQLRRKELKHWSQKVGLQFNELSLLDLALTHSSYANEHNACHSSNERLEFVGDAVLDMVVAVALYKEFNKANEGELTKMRSSLVCEESLAALARRLGFSHLIKMGKGEKCNPISVRNSILADACEAIIGACYLDGGLSVAENFINENLIEHKAYYLDLIFDMKSLLQECLQLRNKGKELAIKYCVVEESGPDHNKRFKVTVACDCEKKSGMGVGKSKKQAEQYAASDLFKKFDCNHDCLAKAACKIKRN